MNQHEESRHSYPLMYLAKAWRQHAQHHGESDPQVEITAVPASHGPRGGYWSAFFAPRSGEMVIIQGAGPHPTHAAARDFLTWMLQQLHHNGNITLYPRVYDQEAIA
ncbi:MULTISPECIES: hypothetical protein [unclassified Halomonas]|uniref:hypothetical protein n=1 Tax=unclassified Halomonas TaxID=2609666 RepID=UPI002883B757|nr:MULTISPECIES: hypothetical protein [unclassified Halomonas]MDT0499677.1 hypothetical protein [Halomonas sp. PAR7]MDT0510506.1 hypothetical protein [Halomonas sp. LES1]MDT0592695.1 hypothetical protein [Halomonas sp. PAR8]